METAGDSFAKVDPREWKQCKEEEEEEEEKVYFVCSSKVSRYFLAAQ
jgi:transcription initiation factor IIE alpha subunit